MCHGWGHGVFRRFVGARRFELIQGTCPLSPQRGLGRSVVALVGSDVPEHRRDAMTTGGDIGGAGKLEFELPALPQENNVLTRLTPCGVSWARTM